MKNSEILIIAQRVIDYAKSQGFDHACFQLIDENGDSYTTPEDVAENYSADEDLNISVQIFLDDLNMVLVGDPEDENGDLEITYP